jgi:hypothetical protein
MTATPEPGTGLSVASFPTPAQSAEQGLKKGKGEKKSTDDKAKEETKADNGEKKETWQKSKWFSFGGLFRAFLSH